MTRATMMRALALGILVGGGAMAAAQQQGAISQLRAGEWAIHEVGAKTPARTMCVRDPRQLLQIEHGDAACTFRTITSTDTAATVRYVCPGAGNGTSEVTIESKAIARLHTQGVRGGAPYDIVYEARYGGACRAGLAAR